MLPYTPVLQFRPIVAGRLMIVLSLSFFVLLAGCSKRDDSAQAKLVDSRGREISKPKPRDDFERGKDEAITADTYFAAGQLSETQDSASRAEEYYQKALARDPMHRGSLFRLGVMTAKQKRYGESIEFWNKYVKATNGDATGYANLGFCLELAGRSDEAEAAYRKGLSVEPLNAPCRVNFGLMLARHDRVNEALLEMQTVLPEGQVHYNIASAFESQGKKDEARAEYRRALEADPKMADAQSRLDLMN